MESSLQVLNKGQSEAIQVMYAKVEKHSEIIFRALSKHIDPIFFLSSIQFSMMKTPKLALCTPASLLGGVIQCAQVGLIPGSQLGQIDLVPYKGKATVVLGYKGMNILATRAGMKSVYSDVICEGDLFEWELGTNGFIKHRPDDDRDETQVSTITHAYSIMEGSTSGKTFKVMSKNKLEWHRSKSPSGSSPGSAWMSFTHEMYQKTVQAYLLRKFGSLDPISSRIIALDDIGEMGLDQELDAIGMATFDLDEDDQAAPPPAKNGNGKKGGRRKTTSKAAEKAKNKMDGGSKPATNGTESSQEPPEEPPPACPPGDSFGEDSQPAQQQSSLATPPPKPGMINGVPEKEQNTMTLGQSIKFFADQYEYGPSDLSKYTGCDESVIEEYLNDTATPLPMTLSQICIGLGLQKEDVLFLTIKLEEATKKQQENK